jgi:UDP-N-acetylmuramoyl-tripeptide--D-alanyl-D-alanine ligase
MDIALLYQIFRQSEGVTTDTRNIKPGQLFFALKGEKFNANSFAESALQAGASYVIIDEPAYKITEKCIVVQNVLDTLQQLANFHRKALTAKIISLTGSNGKTTNKELLMRVLRTKFKVHATQGNLNNHIGVPLTLLAMPVETEIAIIEMGANHQQEIAQLSAIAEPDFGFITNIGKAHLEGFGGPEGVEKGKGELFDYLVKNHKTAFINENDPVVTKMAHDRNMMLVVRFGKDSNALKMISESPEVLFQTADGEQYTCHLSGKYNFDNMQTAYTIGLYFGISSDKAAQAIADYNPDNNRSQRIDLGSNSFLMDAYNANPSSMQASVKNFGILKTEKSKIVILGDMFELGEYAQTEHAELGKLVADQSFDEVVLYGENMQYALQYLPKAYYFTDKFSLHNWLLDRSFQNYYFLVKGSRSVSLESVLAVLKEAKG